MKPKMFDAVSALVEGQISGSSTFESFIYHEGQTPPTKKAVEAKLKELQAEYDAKQYQRDRAAAYPSYADQLDTIYHQGLDAWKAEIKAIKDAHPKPE